MPDLSTPEGATLALISLLEAGDLDGTVDLYEEGAVFVDLEGEVRGEGIREAHRRFIEEGNRLILRRSVRRSPRAHTANRLSRELLDRAARAARGWQVPDGYQRPAAAGRSAGS